jgi:uncharacterized protein (TIGR03437 family)
MFLTVCPCGFSAALSISNQTAIPGQTVAVPALLATAGQAIAGIQFDLQWDPALAVQVTPGAALGQSSKVLYSASPTPGPLRYLIVGANLNSLADGALLELFITVGDGAVPGVARVSLTNVLGAGPTGDAVPLQPVSASVQIQIGTTQNGATQTLALAAESVLNGASLLPGSVAPGEIVTVLGSFPPASQSVLFNGIPAPLLYAGTEQVNAIVPFGLNLNGPVDLRISSRNQTVAEGSLPVAAAAPAIFTQAGGGAGPGAALNEDYSLNSFSNPAAAGSILMVYGTGFGLMQSPVSDGQIASGPAPLALTVTATIGGMPAECTYSGAAPTLVAGIVQINVRLPEGLPTNPYTPILLTIGSATTQPGVTVSIR